MTTRLFLVMLLAFVMSTWQKYVYCVAQTDRKGLTHNPEETTLGAKEQPRSSSSIFKLSNLLPSFMKRERPRPTEERDGSRKHSLSDTSTSTLAKQEEDEEPLPAAFSKQLAQNESPETSQTSNSMSRVSDASFPISARTARDSDEPTKEGHIGRLHRLSSRHFERSMMRMPVRGRLVMSEGSSSPRGKQSSQESEKSQVQLKIKEFAERSSSLPKRGEVVRIGDADIPRRKVTAVGDVDGNKVTDYIVSNVAAKNYSGTVRLYLMGEGDSFLYTRDLIPGKWGFEHPELNDGDRFGATVFRLPNTGSSSQCFIAITAPGDRSTKDENGSVYILEVTEKGNVNNHTKLSATEFLQLVEEQQKEEQTHRNASDKPLKKPSPQISGLQHLDGVTSILLINATGGVQAVLNVQASKHNNLLQQIETQLADERARKSTLDDRMDRLSSRVAQEGSCLFSKTECACKLDVSDGGNDECFDVFQSKEKRDKVICLKKTCPPAYKCSCEGKDKCRRIEETEEIYTPDSRGDRGELYCTSEKRLVPKIVPLTEA